jgi:fibro-slime domain-containing protein
VHACLTNDIICALVEGDISAEETAAVVEHLDECEGCLALVADVGRSWAPAPGDPAGARGRPHIIGRYAIEKVLGAGSMGVVYQAHDPQLRRTVALKVLRADPEGGATALRDRVLAEARALARLTHPNVVRVYDVGMDGNQVYLCMEHIAGPNLREWLEGERRPWPAIVAAFAAAGRGLAAAHGAGIVHRDFKPENVVLAADGRVLVTDFGLAFDIEEQPPDDQPGSAVGRSLGAVAKRTSLIAGTPAYLAPERWLGSPAEPRSDQFSFCVALYEALWSVHPFGETEGQIRAALLASRRRPPRDLRGVPARVHRILARGLAPVPGARFPSMDHLLLALGPRPRSRKLRLLALAAGAAALAVAAALVGRGNGEGLCAHPERWLSGVWNDQARAQFAQGPPGAADAAGHIDRYAADWLAQCRAVCRGGTDDPEARTARALRLGCLARRLEDLREALVRVPERSSPRRKDAVIAELKPAESCADLRGFGQMRPPADPTTATAVQSVRAELAAMAGSDPSLHEVAERTAAALAKARAIGHPPLLAEALYAHARAIRETQGAALARIELADAAHLAAEIGYDEIRKRALTEIGQIETASAPAARRQPSRARDAGRPQKTACDSPEEYLYTGRFIGEFYNLPCDHPDVEKPISDLVTGTLPSDYDWFDDARHVFTGERDELRLPYVTRYFPVNTGLCGDPHHFAVHWYTTATLSREGSYSFRLGSDDDSWLLIDGQLVLDLGGIHGLDFHVVTVPLTRGPHRIDVYFADRHVFGSGLLFEVAERPAGARIDLAQRRCLPRHGDADGDGIPNEDDETPLGRAP